MSGSEKENTLHAGEVIVQVTQGKLRGTVRRTVFKKYYVSFLNIPYAAPPTGGLRFKDPQPPACWEGIRDKNKDGNVRCAQVTRYPSPNLIGSEDCLYLNIYVPYRIRERTRIAVMVWIHGGDFSSGSGNFTDVRPDYLLEEDIILVTINYKLGVFGFLNLNHVAASGNQGLKDQVAALQWIKENIAVFGGDPNNVTVFCSNLGAVCVHLLMLSPLSTSLFHKAILQGGGASICWPTEHFATVRHSQILAWNLDIKTSKPEDIIETLSKVSVVDIMKAQFLMLNQREANMCRVIFGPSIDNHAVHPFLACSPDKLLHNGGHISIILGHTSCEYLRFLDESTQERLEALYLSLSTYVRHALPPDTSTRNVTEMAEVCRKKYFRDKPPTSSSLPNILRCYNDINFDIPIKVIADVRNKLAEASTYVYQFSYVGNQKIIDKNLYWYNIHMNVSSEGDDLPYLFFTPMHKGGNISPPDSETHDFKMIRIMTWMWTNFAKTGVPLPPNNIYTPVEWKPATKEIFYYLDINEHFRLREKS